MEDGNAVFSGLESVRVDSVRTSPAVPLRDMPAQRRSSASRPRPPQKTSMAHNTLSDGHLLPSTASGTSIVFSVPPHEAVDEHMLRETLSSLHSVLSDNELAALKVSADRLRRPKLNFLYRIFSEVTRVTGFCAHVFDDVDGQRALKAVAGVECGLDKQLIRSGKLEYFNRIQIAVSKAMRDSQQIASTRKLITGKDSVGANRLVQNFCVAARAHVNEDERVREVCLNAASPTNNVLEQVALLSPKEAVFRDPPSNQVEDSNLRAMEEENQMLSLAKPSLKPDVSASPPAVHHERFSSLVQEKLDRAKRKLQAVTTVESLLNSVHRHASTLHDAQLSYADHGAAFDALLSTLIGPHAEVVDDLHAKSIAADTLHQHVQRFPTKRELLVNALVHLDQELMKHGI